MPQIGMLTSTFDPHAGFEGFRQGLHDLGYMEGQSIALESRFAEGKVERLPALAARLVSLKVDVILATGVLAARAAHGTGLPLAPRSPQRSVTDICCLRASRTIDRCLSRVQPGVNPTLLSLGAIRRKNRQMKELSEDLLHPRNARKPCIGLSHALSDPKMKENG